MKTKIIEVDPQFPDIKVIADCARVIRQGGLVIFPTETVYGIAADFGNPRAMKRLREVKKRDEEKPFSILISQRGLISNYTSMKAPIVYKLIDAFWPGPLTMIVPAKEEHKTIGIRMPDHKIALMLVQESQSTIAAPSANTRGSDPPTTCREALRDLDGLVDLAIEGGPAKIGIGSSVVDLTRPHPTIIREGSITQADIDRVAKIKTILFVCTGNSCRSVMAEFMLKKMIQNRDDVEVLSAGTGVFVNARASAETISVLRDEGIDATGHLSQAVNSMLLKKADLIFVMTRLHRQHVLERVPEVEKRVYLLKEFTNSPGGGFHNDIDIPDPIGQTHQAYRQCLGIIAEAVERIVKLL